MHAQQIPGGPPQAIPTLAGALAGPLGAFGGPMGLPHGPQGMLKAPQDLHREDIKVEERHLVRMFIVFKICEFILFIFVFGIIFLAKFCITG